MKTQKYLLFKIEMEHEEGVDIHQTCKEFSINNDSEEVYITNSEVLDIMDDSDFLED